MKIKITHTADIQVKNRNVNLFEGTQKMLFDIEQELKNNQSEIYVISGDLFEYATPNDSERKLIYNHISRLIQIPTLNEIVIISGNHDLVKDKKQLDTQEGYNPINIFVDIIKYFDTDKIVYCDKSGVYESAKYPIDYLVYSLEDNTNWDKLKHIQTDESRIKICLYHAMLREYVDYKKLPLQPSIKNKLDTLDIFPQNSYILAGDIHEPFIIEDDNNGNNKMFIYPGAPMQHTFGEGNYISIGEKITKTNNHQKYINNYVFEDGDMIDFEKKELFARISYNTISLDNEQYFDIIIHNIKENLGDFICVGEHQTFVRIKSSNLFLTKERELYEAIKAYINNSSYNISFEYDKFIQKNNYVDNQTIQTLIDEKANNFETDTPIITSDNVDDLILDTTQIRSLFESVLTNMVNSVSESLNKNITTDSIHEEILQLFVSELEKTTQQSSKRYDIKFVNIETNNFMVLGDNNINLDTDGITRILGTNGVGKTTLYRMIRWALKSQIFEGMSNNQVVKNNLLVFNKNLIDSNEVFVKLKLVVNNQEIEVIRTIKRTWKKDVSDEQKLLKNWGDFISNLERNFEIKIYREIDGKQEVSKTITGDQAESFIDTIFGSTINNILFLNQIKINQLLNTSSDVLNELILNYIGVDYLDKLENNLDVVKSKLFEVSKPKRKHEDIFEDIVNKKIQLKNTEEILDTEISNNKERKKELDIIFDIKDSKQQELIDYGNIPKLIEDEIKTIDELKSKNTEPKTKQNKPVFDEKQPELDITNLLNKQQELVINLNKATDNLIKQSKTYEDCYNNEFITNVNSIKEKLNKLISNINDKKKELSDVKIFEIYNACYKLITEYRSQINNKHLEITKTINSLDNDINNINDKIKALNKQLESGVCSECNRAFSDDWESTKQTIYSDIEKSNNLISVKQQEKNELTIKNDKLKNYLDLYDSYAEMCMEHKFDIFDLDIKQLKDTEYKQNILDIKEQLKKHDNTINECNNFIKMFDNAINVKTGDFTIKENLDKLNDNRSWLIDIKNILVKLVNINYEFTKAEKVVDDLTKEKEKIDTQISNEKDSHQTNMSQYLENLNNHRELVESIEKENEKVVEYNNSLEIVKSDINKHELILENLQLKLPNYNNILKEIEILESNKTKIDDLINSSNNDITKNKILVTNIERDMELLKTEEENYYLYEKNNIIWKIYSKLIKTNFKDIVFEYYRTFLNNTMNNLLSDVNFKLYWDKKSELTMLSMKDGVMTYQSMQQASGMEGTFLGLALIYTIQILSVKNTLSHLFIDEISGTLNKGSELSYVAADYQQLFVKILSKFVDKSIFIIDHAIEDIGEKQCLEVIPNGKTSKYIMK